jgi:sugar/nucleoside kinase (ribokinase family)
MLRETDTCECAIDLLSKARKRNKTVFFDPGPSFEHFPPDALDQVLKATDILVLNHLEAEGISGVSKPEEAAEVLAERVRDMVVIKSGSKGCYVLQKGQVYKHPGFSVPVVDAVGAGDSFLGAFMRGILDGCDLDTTCALANAAGAVKVQKPGSGTQVPTVDELLHLLNANGYRVSKEQLLNRRKPLKLRKSI